MTEDNPPQSLRELFADYSHAHRLTVPMLGDAGHADEQNRTEQPPAPGSQHRRSRTPSTGGS